MSASLVYLIDNTIDGQGASPRELRAGLERVREQLEILTEPYHAASLKRLEEVRPSHIVLSGQSHPWDNYNPDSLAGVIEIIKKASQPLLGVCGGHQLIAAAFGAKVDLMGRLEPGEGYEGAKRERGFFEVETVRENGEAGLFKSLPRRLTVWHSHFDEVKELPEGFRRTAFNETCAIQAMQHEQRPLFGVQFHPELFNDEHPEGRQILENFLGV
ncbi:MAG TPA: gamma-glutamyl-gamma-aminobutyrate hydrolase family protein [Pyrinomonadaceae bacterium]|nr:gamma-glutamyl-gamma-aminobutyrate hydrolase family protein [Pyrinomonadaceae bacterium]